VRNQLEEHLQLQALINKYLSSRIPIKNGVVEVNMSFKDFNTPWVIPVTKKRVTTVDYDISDMFGLGRNSYFFNWTEVVVGPIVTVQFIGKDTIDYYSGTMDQPKDVQAAKIREIMLGVKLKRF
jgi:hypothetical protein